MDSPTLPYPLFINHETTTYPGPAQSSSWVMGVDEEVNNGYWTVAIPESFMDVTIGLSGDAGQTYFQPS